ncbi:MAG: hypothetical protein IJU14_04435 [Clostridia bacterium]|nr:hypothetical protein [Clostridia bacterium]
MKTKKIKKFKLSKLFENSKFIWLFSFILACFFWVAFASQSDEISTVIVSDVPVTVELPEQAKQDGLKVYRGDDIKVSVQIRGNRLTVGSVNNADLQVVAQNTSSITFANTYALGLTTRKLGMKSDYEVVSISPSVINVTVDKERTQQFTIEKNINTSEVTLPVSNNDSTTEYYLAKPVISENNVTVTGPEQEVKKIAKVQVYDRITGQQSENISKTLDVQLLDSAGEIIENELLNVSPKKVNMTIQILPKKEIPIIPRFLNIPDGMNIDELYSVKPSQITVAGTESILNDIDSILLDPIDFNSLDPTKTQITSSISLPTGCINISNEEQARISLRLSNYSSTVVTISNIETVNVPFGYRADVSTKSLSISVAGPKDIINQITSDNVKVSVDLSSLASGFEGSKELPAEIDLSELENCWCFNEYTVNVSIKKI